MSTDDKLTKQEEEDYIECAIDVFTDEVQNYQKFLESEKEKKNDSLTKFITSVGKEIGFENETRSIN